MIPIEKLEQVQQIVSHYNCADGTVAAMICVAALQPIKPDIEVEFSLYNDKQHGEIEPVPGLMFVDFTPPYAKWEAFRDVGTIVLDHHASARPHISGENVVFGDSTTESGALLCYRHVLVPMVEKYGHISEFSMLAWKYLSELICVYDTWQQKNPRWDMACDLTQGVLFFGHKECLKMARLLYPDVPLFEKVGHRWNRRIANKAKQVAETALIRDYYGLKIAVYNNTEKITSEVGNLLGNQADFSIGFQTMVNSGSTKMVISFRSRGWFDTTCLSVPLGGGGHFGASGVLLDIGPGILPDIEKWFQTIAKMALDWTLNNVMRS